MLHTYDCLRTRSKVQDVKRLDNNIIAIATQLHGARLMNMEDCQTITTITHENLNAETKAICFSKNAELLAFSAKSYIFILHIPSNIVLKTVKTDGENIDLLSFDLESKYIVAGTTSGRILQYRYDGSSLLARLYSYERPQVQKAQTKATCFAFHSHTMVCGSSNGILFSINLHSRANKAIMHNDNAQINSICFLNEDIVASADSKGNIYFNSLKKNTLIKKIETGFVTIKQIMLLPNQNYMLVSSEEKNIALYELSSYKLLHNKYIECQSDIRNMLVANDETLIVALENNSVEQIPLPKADKLKAFIRENALDKAFNLVQQNPLLKSTKEYKILEIAYDKVYQATLNALMKQNNTKAQELTKMFKYVDAKKDEIQALFKAFENYPRFKILYSEKKYPLAYAMAAKFPQLSQTFQYGKMEELWEETFHNAQRQIAHGKIENAITLLHDYATIAQKRPIIKLILKHNENFLAFLKAIETDDFQTISTLAKNNELFTHVPTYKNALRAMEALTKDIQIDIQKCNLNSAIKSLSRLQNITSVESIVTLQKQECKAIKKLQDAYKINDFIQCFEILDANYFLNTTDLGVLLQSHWIKLISQCEGYALKGNIKDIKQTLGELIALTTRRDKVGDLFRLAFHTKMKAFIHKKTYKKAEAIIYSYIDIFGADNEVLSIMQVYEKKSKVKLAVTQNARVLRDKWIESELIMGM